MAKKADKKATRRARGTGSIFANKRRGGWVGRDKDRNEVTGKTQQEVVAKLAALKPPGPSTTVGGWCDEWFAARGGKPQTRDEYEVCLRLRIKPTLGALRLDQLTPYKVEEAIRTWQKTVGNATVLKTIAVLSAALQAAHRNDLVPRNAARPAQKPTAPKMEIDPFTPAELVAIIRAGIDRPEWRTFSAQAATGMRVGEAMALAADAYDAKTGRVTISRTKTRRHGLAPPKSARGTRTVNVPLIGRPVFAAGVPQTNHTTAQFRWAKLLAHLGLRSRNGHQIRHSVATHAIASGRPIANVARDLGDTVDVVVRTYLHPVDDGRDVCSALEEVFAGL